MYDLMVFDQVHFVWKKDFFNDERKTSCWGGGDSDIEALVISTGIVTGRWWSYYL